MWSCKLPSSILEAAHKTHHNVFDPDKSCTFKISPGETWNITYGDNSSASGTVGTDVVNVGGINVHGQAVEMAKKMSPSFVSGAGDGLMGLAWVCPSFLISTMPI